MRDPNDPVISAYLDLVRLRHTRQMVGAGLSTKSSGERFEVAHELIDLWRHLRPQEPPPPPPLLDRIELDTGYITFGGGVPVGGYSHAELVRHASPPPAGDGTGVDQVEGRPPYEWAALGYLPSTAPGWSERGAVPVFLPPLAPAAARCHQAGPPSAA
jgi:hypothetical protein